MSEDFVLVTGGAGYIGSHTCKALAKFGYTPVTFDNLSTGNKSSVKWGPFIHGDLLESRKLEQTFDKYNFLGVMHFAAKAYVGESVKDPLKYFEGNINSTINLLNSMKKANITKFVFSSSCAIYGEPAVDSISENTPPVPINPYGFSKLACEQIIQFTSKAETLTYAILRYFNAAGADPEGDIGEIHDPETHLIPLALKAALNNAPFTVYGNDYPTPDGTAIRDYIHVSDLAIAHVKAFLRIAEGGDPFICNLGTGTGYSILQIMDEIKLIFSDFEFGFESRRAGDPAKLVANINLSKNILGLNLIYSDLSSILKNALEWEKLVGNAI
jgi:UDP-glucose-4-epimerase GalE